MNTYHIQESSSSRKGWEERILGIVVLILLVACGLASLPVPSYMTSRESSFRFDWERLHATQVERLQARAKVLENEIRRLSKALENTQADLHSFRQVHDTLIAQVATTTGSVREIEGSLQDSKAQAEKLKEYAALQEQLRKERDEAVSRAKDAAERIRELTLKLQRAGVYP